MSGFVLASDAARARARRRERAETAYEAYQPVVRAAAARSRSRIADSSLSDAAQHYAKERLVGVRQELERFQLGEDPLFGFPRNIDLTERLAQLDAAIARTR